MEDKKFRASLSRGRNSWCVIFQHPLRMNSDGRPGLRVRRGLGTSDTEEAQALVDQLNILLSDKSFWNLSARERALRQFNPKIVSTFYSDIETRTIDPWVYRDAVIPLPNADDGYSIVQIVGATGAGKTTLLRQLIGTHPKHDRFPSTSTAKTTIFDTEIILAQGPYRAVVSFLPRDIVRLYIEECVVAATIASLEGHTEREVLHRLLIHGEQRFRLSYLLGTLPDEAADDGEEMEDDITDSGEITEKEDDIEVNQEERAKLESRLREFLDRVKQISEELRGEVSDQLDINPIELNPEDRIAFLDLVESETRKHDRAQSLIDDILNEVESKFSLLKEGSYEYDHSEWPRTWVFQTEDRNFFIKTINRFSSNFALNFGRLLAPIVQGMRVSGPFRPEWISDGEVPRFVFIDGEGLGHTPTTAATLPTAVTRRYEIANIILLVDNSKQPMQAASLAVLRSLAASGHYSKLAVVFTHFDLVGGPNLPNTSARKEHVRSSLDNALQAVDVAIGSEAAAGKRLRRSLERKVFYVGGIHNPLSAQTRFTQSELTKLTEVLKAAIIHREIMMAMPVYDMANLVLCIRLSTEQFHKSWNARLGLSYLTNVQAEHWTRIKALSRRFAEQWADQYDNLKPVADLIDLLSQRVAAFIATPRIWKPDNSSEEARQSAIDKVAQAVYSRLHKLIPNRLFQEHLNDWGTAYARGGLGSTRVRSHDIQGIYNSAAPVPGETPDQHSNEFLDIIRDLFREAAKEAGAEVIG